MCSDSMYSPQLKMVTIRQATLSGAMLIADIGAKSYVESHGHSGPVADIKSYVSRKFAVNAIRAELNNGENIFHIISFNGRAVGYSKIMFNDPHPLIAGTAVTKLERLYVLKEYYDLKLGLTLFEFVTDLSKKANQVGIWLFVWIKNQRAITFYKKSGFAIIGNADFKITETHSNPNHIMYLKY